MIELIYDLLFFKPESKKDLKKIKIIKEILLFFIILFLLPTVFLIFANIFSIGVVPFLDSKFLIFNYDFMSILNIFLKSLPFLIPLAYSYYGFNRRYRENKNKF